MNAPRYRMKGRVVLRRIGPDRLLVPVAGDVVAAVLGAWLDDELDPAARAEVEAWLQAHPDDAARVQTWADDRDALRRHFAPVAEEPVPDALARTVWRDADADQPWTRAAVAATGLSRR